MAGKTDLPKSDKSSIRAYLAEEWSHHITTPLRFSLTRERPGDVFSVAALRPDSAPLDTGCIGAPDIVHETAHELPLPRRAGAPAAAAPRAPRAAPPAPAPAPAPATVKKVPWALFVASGLLYPLMFAPFKLVSLRQQVEAERPGGRARRGRGALETAQEVVRDGGALALWRGAGWSVAAEALHNVATLGVTYCAAPLGTPAALLLAQVAGDILPHPLRVKVLLAATGVPLPAEESAGTVARGLSAATMGLVPAGYFGGVVPALAAVGARMALLCAFIAAPRPAALRSDAGRVLAGVGSLVAVHPLRALGWRQALGYRGSWAEGMTFAGLGAEAVGAVVCGAFQLLADWLVF